MADCSSRPAGDRRGADRPHFAGDRPRQLPGRAAGVGLWGAAAAAAAATGPTLGGALVEASSWRLVFLVNLPLGAAILLAGRRRLPKPKIVDSRLPDLAGAAMLALGLAAITLGIVEGNDWGWTSAATLGAFAAGVMVLRSSGAEPDWLGLWLPGSLLTGIGIGLAFPTLGSAAVRDVPIDRFATASAVNAAFRQVGAVLGTAILIAIVGEPASLSEALSVSDGAFLFAAAASLVAGAVTLTLRPVSKTVEAPVGGQVTIEASEPLPVPAAESG